MSKLTLDLSSSAHDELCRQAESRGELPEALASGILERALHSPSAAVDALGERTTGAIVGGRIGEELEEGAGAPPSEATNVRQILRDAGLLYEMSDQLRALIKPGVTLEEVRNSTASAGGPSLSEILLRQRGPEV